MTLWELTACLDGYRRAHAAKKEPIADDRAAEVMKKLQVKGFENG